MAAEWVERGYKKLWSDGAEEDENKVSAEIEACEPDKLEKIIRGVVAVINDTPQTPKEWAAYKLDLLEQEKELGVVILRWNHKSRSLTANDPYPYIGIGVDWSKLEELSDINKCRAYYVLYLMFSNAWFAEGEFPNIYDVL